ncbi:TOPRIM nucleotidyl transferase/hydrolase domain-containing protein [Fusobacterium sp.]|uniref:ATP-dependent nuclease n=1 Tax=Fusobacterium sp. TaxID=68766 RepID=UPI0026319E20|nr:TOPRIM nucleotidyl transferase/hydrolase domain-containing protein [Fusobacterium sp.]
MELKFLSIKNWREIKNIDLRFENLMLFLGQSSEGVNNIISCLAFIFNDKELEKEDIYDGENFTTIKLVLFEKEMRYKLKITASCDGGIRYYIRKSKNWRTISKEEYLRFISKIPFFHISGDLKNSCSKVIMNFLKILKKDEKAENLIKAHIYKTYEKLDEGYYNSEIYRNILFEFFKIITEISIERKESILGNAIILFEDPELFLHPQKSRELYNYFIKISKLGTKIYLKTYSSSFLGLKQYKSICVIKKVNNNVIVVQVKNNIFKVDAIKAFNMNYWINPDRSELFFATRVILVEGQTDKIVISFLGKLLNIFKYDYSIIECGSKSTIPQFIMLLNFFKIPYIVVYDKDNHKWRTKEEIYNSNQKNKVIKSLIKDSLGTYIECENDIEEELYDRKNERTAYKNKPFNALKHISNENYVIPKKLEEKIRKIYE